MKYKSLIVNLFFKYLLKHGMVYKFYNKLIPFVSKSKYQIVKQLVKEKDKIIILDVGAHKGETIEDVKAIFKKNIEIYSFEPTRSLYLALQEKYRNDNNIHIYNLALGKDNSNKILYKSDFSPTNSLNKPNISEYKKYGFAVADKLQNQQEEEISVMKLYDWIEENRIESIDILKIDTQGYELNVLKGLENKIDIVSLIITELQFRDFYFNSDKFYMIFEYLYSKGFILYDFIDFNKRTSGELVECDGIFINLKIKI